MTYFPMGAFEASKFNCTKYPGVCKPMDFETLNVVREMQAQLNRLAKVKGLKLTAVDGDVGPGTVALVVALTSTLAPMLVGSTPISIATSAHEIREQARAAADGLGAPATVAAPIPPKAPTIITPAGLELKAPPMVGASLLDSVKNLGMPTLLLLGVGVVGAGYYFTRKK